MKIHRFVAIGATFGLGILALALSLFTSTKDYGRGVCPRCGNYTDLHQCRECGRVLCRDCWKVVDNYCPHAG